LLVLPNQSTGTNIGIRSQWAEDRDFFKKVGIYTGNVARAIEWTIRIVFGFMGLAVVGNKYRRSVAFTIGTAVNI
jgi:hypothetical protein